MLNELIEVSEYIYDPSSSAGSHRRIKRKILLHDLSFNGLERIMTMIARYFVFHDGTDIFEGRMRAEAALRMWCGLIHENRYESRLAAQYDYLEQNYPWIENWLQTYLTEDVRGEEQKAKAKVEAALKKLQSKRKQFESSSLAKKPSQNDFKTIRYDKVIANAISARGPLKRYYLVCRKRNWEEGLHKKTGGNILPLQEDRILKTVAAYLIESSRKLRPDHAPRFEPANLKDIAYWAIADSRLDRTHYEPFMVVDRPLFNFERGASGNLVKIKPDPEWFTSCGWEIIEATEEDTALDAFLDNNPDSIFFSDNGSCVPLARNVRYER